MKPVSEALILLAGSGSRLNSPATKLLKPLARILDRPLIAYTFDLLAHAGIERVCAVVGYESKSLVAQLEPLIPTSLDVQFIENPNWEKQNGLSVLAAAGSVGSPFLLVMGDHLCDYAVIDLLLEKAVPDRLNLAVDRKIDSIVDLDDAMKVCVQGERVSAIGKQLENYNAIDTGFFVSNSDLFNYLEAAKRAGDCSLADGVRQMAADGKVRAIDIGGAWWQDVDTPRTLRAAKDHLSSAASLISR
jgi:choline kinase